MLFGMFGFLYLEIINMKVLKQAINLKSLYCNFCFVWLLSSSKSIYWICLSPSWETHLLRGKKLLGKSKLKINYSLLLKIGILLVGLSKIAKKWNILSQHVCPKLRMKTNKWCYFWKTKWKISDYARRMIKTRIAINSWSYSRWFNPCQNQWIISRLLLLKLIINFEYHFNHLFTSKDKNIRI